MKCFFDMRRSTDWRLRFDGPTKRYGLWFAVWVGPFLIYVGPGARQFR